MGWWWWGESGLDSLLREGFRFSLIGVFMPGAFFVTLPSAALCFYAHVKRKNSVALDALFFVHLVSALSGCFVCW